MLYHHFRAPHNNTSIPLQQTSLAKHIILNDGFFWDIFKRRILHPLPPTSELALIPWLNPHLSSLLFLPLCSHETNKGKCRTESLQSLLFKGMSLCLLHFCSYFSSYSPPSRSLHTDCVAWAHLHSHAQLAFVHAYTPKHDFCLCRRGLISRALCL